MAGVLSKYDWGKAWRPRGQRPRGGLPSEKGLQQRRQGERVGGAREEVAAGERQGFFFDDDERGSRVDFSSFNL